MSVSLYQRGKTWYIEIHHQGRRIRRSARTPVKAVAQRLGAELAAQLWQESPGAGRERYWLDACAAWLRAGDRSQSDRYSLAALNDAYPDRPLTDCTADSFAAVLDEKTPATFNRYRAIIVAILRHAGIEAKFPARKVKPGRLRFLTRDEWERLYAALPAHLKPIASFALATGLRQKNVTHLRWTQVDMARAVAWIHPDETKAGKPIGIPLSAEAIAILRAQATNDRHAEWVFPYRGRGRPAGAPMVKLKTAWQAAMARAGLGHFERWETQDGKAHKRWIGDVTFHTLRHTWASWHAMSGTPQDVLQRLGGWHDARMVQNYAHLAPDYLAGWANNAKPWSPDGDQSVA